MTSTPSLSLVDRFFGAAPGDLRHYLVALGSGAAVLPLAPWWAAVLVAAGSGGLVVWTSKDWPQRLLAKGQAERALAVARFRGEGRVLQEARAQAVMVEVRALCALGRKEEAVERARAVMKSLGRGLGLQTCRVQLGVMMVEHGCFEPAETMLTSLPDKDWYDSIQPMRVGNLAAALIAQDRAPEALRVLGRHLVDEAQGRDRAMLANNRAVALIEAGVDPAEALELAQVARAGFPRAPSTASTLGAAMLFAGQDPGRALALLEEATLPETVPAPMRAWVELHHGLALHRLGRQDEAGPHLARALADGTAGVRARAQALAE